MAARRTTDLTFHGSDPEKVASGAICLDGYTRCQARTRVYRDGALVSEGFPVAEISDYLDGDESVTVWLDLRNPDRQDLAVLSEEFGLHSLAVEDAIAPHERPKLDRYRDSPVPDRLRRAARRPTPASCARARSPRSSPGGRSSRCARTTGWTSARWSTGGTPSPDLAKDGVGYLVHGLLDYIVDGHFEAVQSMDEQIEALEDQLFADIPQDMTLQRRSFQLRKSLVLLRRVVLPMREIVNALMRRDLHVVTDDLMPYYQDVYDHVLRATEWTDSLRDLVTSILETNLTIQGNRMNIISKQVTGWAAIIAVPTFITGFYGMNVPYPEFGRAVGFGIAMVLMVTSMFILYIVFRRRSWL